MTEPKKSIRVVGIYGSLRRKSFTRLAVEAALRGAEELGAQTELLDLADFKLVFCDGGTEEGHYPADVYRLREIVKSSEGIILGTPEYHGSYSGVLKNALDLMGFDEFSGKMLGLVGVSAGALGGLSAVESLRTVGRTLHSWVVPHQAAIPEVHRAFDADGGFCNPKMEQRVMEVGRQVTRFSVLHHSQETREFVRLWEEAPANPGGDHEE